ncbi:MAG: 2-dehydropantoate 2-reductase [Alphaproteobacteria bacterium]
MKIAIYGAGAIGGYLGAELAQAGYDVSLIARGPHLAAIRERGLTLLIGGATRNVKLHATDTPSELGVQDYVFVTVKANAAAALVEPMRPLLGPATAVVTAMNGIPWWYFYKLPGPFENRILASVDPGGAQWNGIGPARAIGCVVYPAAEIAAPGVIKHVSLNRFSLGEPDGGRSERVQRLADALIKSNFSAPVRTDIRDEIWIKLWGNLSFNPISALTHATLDQMANDPNVRAVIRNMMLEAKSVAERLGVRFAIDVERRIDGAGKIAGHKTSMLQDLESRRPMEIDPLVGAVQEMARLTDVATPTIDLVLSLVRAKARVAGLYR